MRLYVHDASQAPQDHLQDGVHTGPVQVTIPLAVFHQPRHSRESPPPLLQTHAKATTFTYTPAAASHVLKLLPANKIKLFSCLLTTSDWPSGVCRKDSRSQLVCLKSEINMPVCVCVFVQQVGVAWMKGGGAYEVSAPGTWQGAEQGAVSLGCSPRLLACL